MNPPTLEDVRAAIRKAILAAANGMETTKVNELAMALSHLEDCKDHSSE